MKVKGTLLLLVVAAGTWPRSALAQDAITGESIEVHATFFNVGVMVAVSGDDNGNASASLEVEVNGSGFRPAHRLSRTGADRFVGSAFFLPEGTGFGVRVTLSDPDGTTNEVLTASGTLRRLEIPEADGDTIHVSPIGDDEGNDGSESSPFATVSRGVEAAEPGDTVLIHAGTYHEEVYLPRGGTVQAPIAIRSAGDGPAVLDGAAPDLKDAGAWTDEGGGVYSAAVAGTRYVAVNGVRLWRYESLADLQNLSEGMDGGFFFQGGRVYVRLSGDAAPQGKEIQVSTLGRAFWLEATPYLVIRGLTIRCYGSEQYSQGIMVRDGSHGVWIAENSFENVMPGIWVKNEVDDLTVIDNEFSDRGLGEFPWAAVKAQGGMESGAIGVDNQYQGQGIVFYRNRVHDSFDGLGICGDQVMARPNNADVMGNTLYHLGDDGIETDGECVNVRILMNRFEDTLVGVSAAPAVGGPTYVIRNLMVDLKNVAAGSDWMTRALKFNVGDPRTSGEVFAYHNTAVTYEAGQASFAVTDDSRWSALHLANNIWVGTDYGFTYTNTGDEPLTQRNDLIFSTGTRWVSFQAERYGTVDEYFAATGLCDACLALDPAFTDGPGGDYTLTASSPAVDRGLVINGVNDDFAGDAPDLGAHELGGPEPGFIDAGVAGNGAGGSSGEGGIGGGSGSAGADSVAGTGGETGGGAGAGGSAAGDAGGLVTGEDGGPLSPGASVESSAGGDSATSGCGCRLAAMGNQRREALLPFFLVLMFVSIFYRRRHRTP